MNQPDEPIAGTEYFQGEIDEFWQHLGQIYEQLNGIPPALNMAVVTLRRNYQRRDQVMRSMLEEAQAENKDMTEQLAILAQENASLRDAIGENDDGAVGDENAITEEPPNIQKIAAELGLGEESDE